MDTLKQEVLNWIDEDADAIVRFFSDLVKCKSPNPPGDTREAMSCMQRFLSERGIVYREVNAREDWPNLIASVAMARPGRHVMFNGHLDVFPASNQPGWTDDPWSGKIADGRVWGRGTGDMKAGLTASTFAFSYLARLQSQLKGKVSLTVVSDEENGGRFGAGHLFEKVGPELAADCVISGESTTTRGVSFGGKGYVQLTIKVATPGAHASAPFKSGSAIRIAADIIRDLDAIQDIPISLPPAFQRVLDDPKVRDLMGPGADYMPRITLNVGTIQGGAKVNVIASDCTFEFEARIPIGADPDVIEAEARAIVKRYPEAVVEHVNKAPPDYSDPNGELAVILQDTVEGLGLPRPSMIAAAAQSDCKYWRQRSVPAYWFGPTPVAGTANESVSIEELMILVRTHTLAALEYLRR